MTKGSSSRIALLFVFCAPFFVGGIQTQTLKASALSSAIAQSQDQKAPDVRTFAGKVLSQNGERFILRDEANDVWYHLDDQQQAGKFAGKNVLVTGVLDGRTDTIKVREITEAKA
jgi:Tfp pilus assembly protein FimT